MKLTTGRKTFQSSDLEEKEIILKKLQHNPFMSLKAIADSLKISTPTLLRRMQEYGIEHGRKRGVKKGTHIKKLIQ